ncbi:ABC transporter substrate-binding protein [Acidihalobacter ferrooxydans]|uniref:ABC transporter substrate-binding protein n=1 Tax=Acidihalobacter ferrooxydans TaxID=1765967 RepID=A0A1P8UDA2_9GAMM|nr:ABC transporter substrate-binding protein [Acidihalobacter ferrooxydans]APZ41798.1 ABC transporter substrate-binding protein [Acidihalobacter ferrooxydans]
MRHSILRTAAAALIIGTACTALPAMAGTPPGVLIVGQSAEPKSLDPAVDTAVTDFRILTNIYNGLTHYKSGTLQPAPALATSWTISKNGLVYTFDLRKGVKFQDGTPFNAEAVKFNFDRMLDKNDPYHKLTGPFPLAFFFSDVDKVTVLGPYKVQFTLKKPYAPFLSNLAYPTGLIVSPTAVKKYGKNYGSHPVGTGPFEFVEWDRNNKVVLKRNPHYWNGEPALKTVIFRPITDTNTRVSELLSGGINVMFGVPPNSLRLFQNANFKTYQQVGPHVWFVILNEKDGPLKSKLVRQAMNYAVNKEAIVKNVLKGTATVANGPIAPAFAWAYDKNLKPYPYDPAKAKKLLAEAGYPHGFSTTFYVTQGGSGMLSPVEMGTAIQADLAKVGIKVKIETFEWNTFLSKVNAGLKGNVGMAEMAWMTNSPDTLPFLTLRTQAWPSKGGFNSGYYSNPEVDKLLEQARTSSNQAERAKLYKKVQVIVHNDAPWIFVANWKQNAVTTANVKDFKLQPSFFLLLHDVKKP